MRASGLQLEQETLVLGSAAAAAVGFQRGWASGSLCTPQPRCPGLTSAQPALQQSFCLGPGSPGPAPYALHLTPCVPRTPTPLSHPLHPPIPHPRIPKAPIPPLQPHPCQFLSTGASSPDPLPLAPDSTVVSTEIFPPSSPAARTTEPTRGHSEGRHGGEPPVQPRPACPPGAAALLPDGSSWSPAASAGTAPVNSSGECSPARPVHTPEITFDTLRDSGTNREKSRDQRPRWRTSTRGKSQKCQPSAAGKHLIPLSNGANPQCPSRTHLTHPVPFLAQSWGLSLLHDSPSCAACKELS